ncbi:MAG: hypothetical protein RLY93_10435 [Sumerlaeia bacterium]
MKIQSFAKFFAFSAVSLLLAVALPQKEAFGQAAQADTDATLGDFIVSPQPVVAGSPSTVTVRVRNNGAGNDLRFLQNPGNSNGTAPSGLRVTLPTSDSTGTSLFASGPPGLFYVNGSFFSDPDPLIGGFTLQSTSNSSFFKPNAINLDIGRNFPAVSDIPQGEFRTFTFQVVVNNTASPGGFYSGALYTNILFEFFQNPGDPGTLSSNQRTNLFQSVLAVELNSFEATTYSRRSPVQITWTTETETDNLGFDLYRVSGSIGDEPVVTKLNDSLIPAKSPQGASYSFIDSLPLMADNTRTYVLVDIDTNGKETTHGPVEVSITPRPRQRPSGERQVIRPIVGR